MNKTFLKLASGISTVWVMGMLCLSIPGHTFETAKAQGLSSSGNSGGQLFCTRDFSNFLANGVDFDGEGFTDYWRDLTVIYNNNYCQYTDIVSLLDRIDKVRAQLRQAFYVCDNETAQRTAAQYYDLSAEVYYLRHFVDTSGPANPKSSKAEKDQNVTNNLKIHDQFIKRFVTDAHYFSAAGGEAEFVKFQQKYATKIQTYRNCTDPNLSAIKQKISDIQKTYETIKNLGNRFVQHYNDVVSKTKQRIAANPGLISSIASGDSIGDVLKNTFQFRANGENFTTSTVWEGISNTAKAVTPGVGPNIAGTAAPVGMNQINNDLNVAKQRNESEDLDITYMGEYDIKYRQGAGLGLDQLVANLQDLQKILNNTYVPLGKVEVCAANIVSKQCGG